jgi:U3 small nucleolar RNA-associated protein 18
VSPEFASTGLVAVGSASGVVNMYDVGDWSMQSPLQRPTPRLQKSLLNLVTPSTSLNFSPDGQVLAIASWEKRDALRLVHAESGTVFANWPTSKTPIRYPFSVDFSPVGGYLAVGNDRGRVLLYQMKYAAGR